MRPKLKEIAKDQSGAALIFVLLALVIVSIFSIAIVNLVHENLSQATAQEDAVKAYYLALSGSDLCYAALMQEGTGGENDTLLYQQFSTAAHADVDATPILTDTMGEADQIEGGTIALTVKAFEREGERWVEINSTATLHDSSVSKTTTLQFLVSNPMIQFKS